MNVAQHTSSPTELPEFDFVPFDDIVNQGTETPRFDVNPITLDPLGGPSTLGASPSLHPSDAG